MKRLSFLLNDIPLRLALAVKRNLFLDNGRKGLNENYKDKNESLEGVLYVGAKRGNTYYYKVNSGVG